MFSMYSVLGRFGCQGLHKYTVKSSCPALYSLYSCAESGDHARAKSRSHHFIYSPLRWLKSWVWPGNLNKD